MSFKKVVCFIVLMTMIFWTLGPITRNARATTGNASVTTQPDDYNITDIYRGPGSVFAMSVFALRDVDNDDTLDSVKINIQGSVTASEIASVRIYQEATGNTTFESGSDTALGIAQTTINVGSGTSVTINAGTTTIPAAATRYYVVFTLAGTGLTDGHNLRVSFAQNDALTVSSSLINTNAFSGNCYAIIDSGGGGGGEALYVEDAEYIDANTIEIFFNKDVDLTTSQTVGNYTLTVDGLSIGNPNSATRQPSYDIVRLVKSGANFTSDRTDSVTVSANVTDMAGNANQTTGPVYIISGGGGTQGMLVISEVQVAGATAGDEFIELYNPTASSINLDTQGVKLHIVNSEGNGPNRALTFTNSSIAANGFFLITPASGYDGATTADATYSTSGNMLVNNGAVYISFSTTENSSIIDKVGWGTSGTYEGGMAVNTSYAAASWGPPANASIERKANYASTAATMAAGGADATYGNGYDTDFNFEDFVIQTTANPQGTTSTPATEIQGGGGYGAYNNPPMIMHMSVMRAIKADSTLEIAARMSDESGALAASNTVLYYCASGSGTACDAVSEFTSVTGSSVGSGYFKFTIPASVRNATNVETNDIRYVLKAIDPADSAKIKYMSQSPQADMTCDYGTCDTTNIFANPFTIDIITSSQATSYGCDKTISGTITESGSGLSGVYAFLEGTGHSVTTGISGTFSFANVCPGSYNIIGAKSGYMDGMYWASAGQTSISMSMSQGYMGGGGDYAKPRIMYSMPNDMFMGYPEQENIYVVFDKAMDSSTITGGSALTDNIYLTFDGTNVTVGTVTYYATNTGRPSGAPADPYLMVYNPTANLSKGTNYTLVIKGAVTDANGNSLEGNRPGGGHTLSFTTVYDFSSGGTWEASFGSGANFPPYVQATSPGGGAYDVPVNTKINITFNEAMSSSSISTTNITMYTVSNPFTANETQTAFTGFSVALDSSSKIAIITPSANLAISTHYRVKVMSGCTSAKGTPMSQTSNTEMFRLDFDTASGLAGDSTAPTIAGTYPSDGDTGIPANFTGINIGFSEAMDVATINTNTVKLKQGNTAITASVKYEVGERAAYLMPSVALTPGGTYVIEVLAGSSGVSDIAGNYLADQSSTLAGTQNYNATFTVSTTEDTDYPTIQFANCDDFSCAITFSEPMNSAKIGESDYTAGYSVLNKSNYTIKQAAAGTTSWTGISGVSLTNVNIEYDQMNNTVRLTGLSLSSANDFQVTVANVGDRFINSSNENTHQIGGQAGASSFQGPISNSMNTGGMMGPGGPGPMMGAPTITGTSAGMGGSMGYDFGGNWEKPTNVMPMNMMAGATTKYFVSFPVSTGKAIASGGTIVLTFLSGFDVSSAAAVSTDYSMANKDLNGPASGTPTIASVAKNATARTVTVTTSGAISANDYVMFDLKGIKNSTVPKGFDTNGYTVDIKTKDASGNLLESMTSFPFFIQASGNYILQGTITATSATGGTAIVYLGSPMTGPMETEVTFSSGTASYSFSGLSEGDYYLHTDPSITLNVSGGTADYIGYMTPDSVYVSSSNTSLCSSTTCTKNFSFTKQDTNSAYQLTVYIVGDFSGLDASDSDIDIFAGGPSGHAIKTIDIGQANCTGTSCAYSIYLPSSGEWWVGMSPAMPHGTMMMGPAPMPAWMPPQDVRVNVSGTYGSPSWSEQSGTANDGKITFTITAASNQIIGYVIDGSGNAIANVDVEAHRTQGGFGMPAHSMTDANGKFTLKVTTGNYEINAWMPGLPWSPGRVVDVRADTDNVATDGNSTADVYKDNGTTLVIDLTSGYNSSSPETELLIRLNKSSTTISGKVLDDSGNPVAYAPVWAYNQSTGENMPSGTDSSGNYTIYVSNGNWNVEAFIPGIGDVSYANNPVSVSGSNRSDINIRPASGLSFSTISGTVTIAGSTVSNASVWVDRGTYHNQTNTNSSGEYRLKVPANSGYTLRAWTPDYGELDPVTVDASSNVTQNFTVAASAMHTLTINFTNSSNLESGTEAFIDIFDPSAHKGNHKRVNDLSNVSSTTMSVKDGSNYEMHLHIPGLGDLEPTCANGTNITCTDNSGMPDTWAITGNASVTFVVPDATNLYTFTVTVLSNATTTIESAFVWLANESSGFRAGKPTNANGIATIKVPDGTYKLGADKPGYTGPAPATVITSTDANCVNNVCTKSLTLFSNPYTLSGTITDSSGNAIAHAWVWADKITSATDFSFAGGWTGTETDPNGNYSLSISNGYWLVRAVADGYQETLYTVGGTKTAIQISSASQSGKNIALVSRSGYSAVAPKSAPVTPASGGTIDDSSYTGVKLVIPPSTLGTDTSAGTVNIKDTYKVPKTNGVAPLGGKGKEITATNSSGQAITTLSGSATVEISYSEVDIPTGISESQLMLVYFDGSSNEWVAVSSSQDTTNNKFSGSTTHLTIYAVAYAADIGAPTTPGTPSASSTSSSSVTFSWTASTDNETSVDGYEITRSTDGTNFSTIGSTDPWATGSYDSSVLNTNTSYTNSDLSSSTTYYYQVIAYDTVGNHSASSSSLTVITSALGGGGSTFIAVTAAEEAAEAAAEAEPEPEPEAEPAKPIAEMTKAEIIAQIASIQALIIELQTKLKELIGVSVYEGIPSGFTFTKPLNKGSRGDQVKYLQIIVGATTDGIFGPKTEAAVKEFQKTKGITIDGIVGPQTRGKLNDEL